MISHFGRLNKFVFFVLWMLIVSGCAEVNMIDEAAPKANFVYTGEIEQSIVIPVLRAYVGENYKFFNFDDPSIKVLQGGNVKLTFHAYKSVDGSSLHFDGAIVMIFDGSTLGLSETFLGRYSINK